MNKVDRIIKNHNCEAMAGVTMSWILESGIKNVREINSDMAELMLKKRPEMFEENLYKNMIDAMIEIARDCDLYEDIFPYISKCLPNNNMPRKELTLYAKDFDMQEWRDLLFDLDAFDEECEELNESINVIVVKEGE